MVSSRSGKAVLSLVGAVLILAVILTIADRVLSSRVSSCTVETVRRRSYKEHVAVSTSYKETTTFEETRSTTKE